jgi:ATP synthase mitochondrial F1 complex assembly factor 1
MQFSSTLNQIFYTPLEMYKLHRENATPHLIITHYEDLSPQILMSGEILNESLNGEDAKTLAILTQMFFVTGGDKKRALVQMFHERPHEFSYQALINEAERM